MLFKLIERYDLKFDICIVALALVLWLWLGLP
jgi:hypothetical protein